MRTETRRNSDGFHALAGAVLGTGASLRFRAEGVSMLPFIRDGEEVSVESLRRPVRLGDVLLLRDSGGRTLLHRAVSIDRQGVVTRGDASHADDRHALHGSIIGRVTAVAQGGSSFHLRSPFRQVIALRDRFPVSLLWAAPIRKAGKLLLALVGTGVRLPPPVTSRGPGAPHGLGPRVRSA